MKFIDSHSNVYIHLIDCLSVISNFFEVSNVVDKHNQVQQYKLALEKKYDTRYLYFHLTTSLVKVNITDA